MYSLFVKHPLCLLFTICLLLFLAAGIFFSKIQSVWFIITAFFLIAAQRGIFTKVCSGFLALGVFAATTFSHIPAILVLVSALVILANTAYSRKDEPYIFEFTVIAAAFILHLFYAEYTPTDIRQHDLSGIVLYMREIIKNGLNWQDFNPWIMYYLFHQPLHFIIAGYLYLFELKAGVSSSSALEGLQYLSLFYVTGTTILGMAIFKELKIYSLLYKSILLLLVFHPSLFLFTGYISDDTPVLFWCFAFNYLLLLWYKTERIRYISGAAVCFGFGVLTKLSLLMLIPAAGLLFLCKLWQEKGKREQILCHISLFCIIAVPLALAWIIRNHIFYDMQFYNIPDTSPEGQSFRYLSLKDRISDFSLLTNPFINAPKVADANIFLALIKTELFGEWDYGLISSVLYYPAATLYAIAIILKILVLIMAVRLLANICCKCVNIPSELLFFATQYVTIFIYSFRYALLYPYICSTDYRLFAQIMLPELILIASGCSSLIYKKAASRFLFAASVLYVLLSVGIYIRLVS